MIFLELFLTFFEIGAFTFGGGYAMISLIREMTVAKGWLTEAELMNFIAVSESTPGPIAINMATFVGSSQGGFFGSVCATLGVVLPSFIVILLISILIRNILKYPAVQAVLGGVRPAVVGLILSTAGILFASTFLGFGSIGDTVSWDWIGLVIFALIAVVALVYKKIKKKKISPIVLIIISAILGGLMYSFI